MSEEPISGRMSRLKPWHYALIGGVSVAIIALIPSLNRLTEKKKAEDVTAAVMAANAGGGEPWHAPAFPAPEVEHATYGPTIAPAPVAPPPSSLVANPPAIAAAGASGPADYRMFGQRQQPPMAGSDGQPGGTGGGGGHSLQATKAAAPADGSMGALLKPTETPGYVAARMQHPWATIEEGRIIACNSVTPMTSELPGFVKAKVTHDELSADGTTTLIDRNSTIVGEIGHGLSAGQDRLFVLWREITTPAPDFVRITLNAPAADELGEDGLSGDINNHRWRRIGGALMLSGVDTLLEGVSSALGEALSHGNSNSSGSNLNFYEFQGQGSSLASSLLQHTVEIPDTLHRDHALPCSIFVTGDLDFSSVYQLRLRARQ